MIFFLWYVQLWFPNNSYNDVHQILCNWILCTVYVVHNIFDALINIMLWILYIVVFMNSIMCSWILQIAIVWYGILCNVQDFVHESVCFFMCSITRYGMIEDIEEIILTKSYKVWKVDQSKLFGTYLAELQPSLVNPNYII
jgi:hypothetical protein